MAHVIVVGAGLAGLPAAYELRHFLPSDSTVTLVSDQSDFTFIPGLIQVALNLKPLKHVQLDLASLAQRHRLNWMLGKVIAMDPERQHLTIEGHGLVEYDFLLIATGASLAFDEISGLGPHGGYTQSVCSPDHALLAREAWLEFLENPGPMVVGAAPGAGCFGPAYEFALMAEQELRRRGLTDQAPITYVTPEPYVGHLGVSKVKHARELTANLMRSRGIQVIENAAIQSVTDGVMTLADGQVLPFRYSMVLPSFRGAKFLQDVSGFSNSKGFIPVLPSQRHPVFSTIYAAGVSIELAQPDQTLVPIGLPKSGQMAEAMGAAAAHNIAVDLGAIRGPHQVPTLEALCFAEFGETGIAYIAAPVLPDPVTGKRKRSYAVQGPWVVWVKAAFEEYFMIKMRFGVGMPWYERLGLRILFGLKMLENISDPNHKSLSQASSLRIQAWALGLFGIFLMVILLLGSPAIAQANPDPGTLAKAVQSIEDLDSMRSGLASYLKDAPEPPTAETMKQVCKPVGMKAQQLSQENGWQVKQISNKYRNPAHAPDGPASRKALARFERDAELMGFWQAETVGEQVGTQYYRRIDVEASCLACHGGKEGRPEFVKTNYPEDLAYNFKEGDLRGMYSVFMPEMQAALQDALTQS